MEGIKLSDNKGKELIEAAEGAMKKARAPYSGTTVGAALLTEDGVVFMGANIEVATNGTSICAERSAISNAQMNSKSKIKAIAVVGNRDDAVYPCGICLQVLNEFGDDIVIYSKNHGRIESHIVKEMLPFPYVKSKKKADIRGRIIRLVHWIKGV